MGFTPSESTHPPLRPRTSNLEPAYRVDRLAFAYPRAADGGDGWALRELTFEIARGEIVGLIGPNGSGKSSLLKLLARLLMPLGGTVHMGGRPLERLPQAEIARTVALVPQQQPQLFPFTVAEMVLMGRFPHHRTRGSLVGFAWETGEDLRVAEEAMAVMDVTRLAGRSIEDVSGGERQRAFIARALAQTPEILLLDEPTAHLDLHHQRDICEALRRLNAERGLTVVLVSHDLNLASQYCDRLMLLHEGALVRFGPPAQVLQAELIESVYRCRVLVDRHPVSGVPRVTLPGRQDSHV